MRPVRTRPASPWLRTERRLVDRVPDDVRDAAELVGELGDRTAVLVVIIQFLRVLREALQRHLCACANRGTGLLNAIEAFARQLFW